MCVGVHLGARLDNSNFRGFWVKMKDFWMILSVFCFHRRWSRRSVKASNVLGQVAYLGCLGGEESLCHRLGVLFLPRRGVCVCVDCRVDLVWILRRGAGGGHVEPFPRLLMRPPVSVCPPSSPPML